MGSAVVRAAAEEPSVKVVGAVARPGTASRGRDVGTLSGVTALHLPLRDDFSAALTSLSDHTVAAYSSDLRSFAEWCARGNVNTPQAVTRPTIRRYLAHLTTRRFARSTMARKAAALRRYYRWAISMELVTTDPTSGVSVRGGDGRLPRVLDQRELNGLLDAAAPDDEPDWRRRRDDAVLELLYGSGLRVGELCGLQVSALSLALGLLDKSGDWRGLVAAPIVGENGQRWSGFHAVGITPASITFGGQPAGDLRREIAAAGPLVAGQPAFAGFALHDYEHLRPFLDRRD